MHTSLRAVRMIRAALATIVTVAAVLASASLVAASNERPAGAQSPDIRLLLNDQHVDAMALSIADDGNLVMRARADLQSGAGQDFLAGDVVLQLKDTASSRLGVPDLGTWSFLGAPGDPVWLAPMTQDPSLVWAGWNTESLPAGLFEGDSVRYELLDVQGPGRLEIFQEDPVGNPIRQFSSTDPDFRAIDQPVGSHVHADWVFTAPGTYAVTFEASGYRLDGNWLSTGPVTYTWVVGALSTATTLSAEPVSSGAEVAIAVASEAVTESGLDGTAVLHSGDELVAEIPVADGVGSSDGVALAAGDQQLSVRFAPADTDAYLASTSAPVTVTVAGPDPGPGPGPDPGPDPGPGPGPGPDPDPGPGGECAIDAVLDVGHVDVAARIVDGELVSQVKDTVVDAANPIWRELVSVAFHVRPEAETQVPPGGAFDFIAPAGTTIWGIPQTQDPDLLWAGWNTEAIDYDQLAGPVTWSLDDVEGPGDVAVYSIGSFGVPGVIFDSSEPMPQGIELPAPIHAHGNWAFTAEGIYDLTFSHRATLSSGQQLASGGTLKIAVGDTDLTDLCPGGQVPPPGGGDPDPQPNDPQSDPGSPSTTVPDDGQPPATVDPAGSPRRPAAVCTRRSTTSTTAGPGSAGASSPGGERVTLDVGHVDYAARVVDGTLESVVKDGTVAGVTEWRQPGDVVLHLTSAGRATVPAGAQFGFLGSAGATIWQIPQTQNPDILWLGWNTEELSSRQVTGPVTWTLDAVDGPGQLAVYEFDSFGQPTVVFASSDGVGDRYDIPLGTHAHGNWAFTAEGTYQVTTTHTATLADGRLVTDTETMTFQVGGASASPASLRGSAAAPGPAIRPVSATRPVQDPQTDAPAPTTTTTTGSGGSGAGSDDCSLATTGRDVAFPVALGAVLAAAGAVFTAGARRLRTRPDPA
jgi:putative ABC transporter-associated repeat protein